MMSGNAFRIWATIFLTALAGCRVDFEVDIYSADAFTEMNVRTPAILRLEIPSCTGENMAEYESDALSLFHNSSEAQILGCVNDNMESMLEVRFMAELATEKSFADIAIYREFREAKTDDGRDVEIVAMSAAINNAFLARMAEVTKKNHTTVTFEDISIEIVVQNDERTEVGFGGTFAWIDGKPSQEFILTLKRRDKVVVGLPDLASDLMLSGEHYQFGSFFKIFE